MRDHRSITKHDHRDKIQQAIEYNKMEATSYNKEEFRKPPYHLEYLREQKKRNGQNK